MFDWFFSWMDRFTHSFVMDLVMDYAQWVDWFAILFILLGIFYGMQNGFFAEIAEIFQIMIVIYLVLAHYEQLERFLLLNVPQIPRESLAGVAYIVTGLIVWTIAGLITKLVRRFFHTKMSRPLNMVGGAILGSIHLFMIFSFLCQTILLLPVRQPKRAFEKNMSYTGHYAAQLAPRIHEMIAEPVRILQPTSGEE